MLPPEVRDVALGASSDKLALWLWDPRAGKAFSGIAVQGGEVGKHARSALDHLYSSLRRFFVRPESESISEHAHAPASPGEIQALASREGGETQRMMRVLCTGESELSPGAGGKALTFSWVAAQMVMHALNPKRPTPLSRYVSRLLTVYHRQIRTVRECLLGLGISSGEGTFRTDLLGVFRSSDASDINVTLTGEDVLIVLSDNAHARGGRKGQTYMHHVVLMWKVVTAVELRAISQFAGDTHGLLAVGLWEVRKKVKDLTVAFAAPSEEGFRVIGGVRTDAWVDAFRISHLLATSSEHEVDEDSRFSMLGQVADKVCEGNISEKTTTGGERIIELEGRDLGAADPTGLNLLKSNGVHSQESLHGAYSEGPQLNKIRTTFEVCSDPQPSTLNSQP